MLGSTNSQSDLDYREKTPDGQICFGQNYSQKDIPDKQNYSQEHTSNA